MRKIIRTICYSIQQIMTDDKKKLFLMFADILTRVGIAFCMTLFPQSIVKFLMLGRFQNGIENALLFCMFILLREVVSALNEGAEKKMEVDLNIRLNSELSTTLMKTEYGKIERKSYLEKVDFAKQCMKRNSVTVVYHNVIEIVSGFISLAGIFYIIRRLNLGVLLLIIAAVIIGAVGEVFRLNYVFDRDRKGNSIERNLYYARNELSKNHYAKDIRIWHLYDYISAKVELYAKKLCDLWAETAMKSMKILGWTYLANGIEYVVVYAFLAFMAYEGHLDIKDFVLYSSATIILGDILKGILSAFIAIGSEYQYIESVICVMDGQEEKIEDGEQIGGFCSKIEFIDVWFKYHGAKNYVFEGLNLVIEKEKSYSVVGKNGAGKTTLVKLLLGLYRPERGKILIDGMDIESISKDQYRHLFSCVFQDYNIYGFSIRENIAFDQEDAERLEDAITWAGIRKKIEELPGKSETLLNREINKNATTFSGGQEQQIAIARALYKNAPIYILDEPTAALSPNSEAALYKQFHQIAKDKTVIFISHRLASCILCDEIIVIDGGKVIEQGNHEYLMKTCDLYAEMFKIQAEPYWEGQEE